MALVQCQKCGHQVSTTARACPACGTPPQTSAQPAAASPPAQPTTTVDLTEKGGFFRILLDFSFTHFATLKLVRWLYLTAITFGLLGALILLYAIETKNASEVLGKWIGVLFLLLLWVIWWRVGLEIVASLFRIAENTAEIVRHTRVIASKHS